MANSGATAAGNAGTRLFDSLVSVRPSLTSRVVEQGGIRTDAPHLGLGLYVVRMIAELHGARARAQSADGSGVEFIDLRGACRVGRWQPGETPGPCTPCHSLCWLQDTRQTLI